MTTDFGTPPVDAATRQPLALRLYTPLELSVIMTALENLEEEINGYGPEVPSYMKDTFAETVASLQSRLENAAKTHGPI